MQSSDNMSNKHNNELPVGNIIFVYTNRQRVPSPSSYKEALVCETEVAQHYKVNSNNHQSSKKRIMNLEQHQSMIR